MNGYSVLAQDQVSLQFTSRVSLTSEPAALLPPSMLSFVVPAHNEQACLGRTVQAIHAAARRRREFVWLERPSEMGPITVADFRRPLFGAEHNALIRAGARSAWEAWSRLHATIRRWLPAGWGGALPDGPAGPERAE